MHQLLSSGVMSLLGVDDVGRGADLIRPITTNPIMNTRSLQNELQN